MFAGGLCYKHFDNYASEIPRSPKPEGKFRRGGAERYDMSEQVDNFLGPTFLSRGKGENLGEAPKICEIYTLKPSPVA